MGKIMQGQAYDDNRQKGGVNASATSVRMMANSKGLPLQLLENVFVILFFVAVWALLAFYESALLFRVNELSVFLCDDLFYKEVLSVPAGIL